MFNFTSIHKLLMNSITILTNNHKKGCIDNYENYNNAQNKIK